MQSWTSLRSPLIALCAFLGVLAFDSAYAADISGSIRFADEDFEVDVSTIGSSLRLTARGCNNFDLALASATPGGLLELRNAKGAGVGSVSSSKVVEVRTCRADRYLTELVFASPTTTTWHPRADESLGAKKVQYTARLAPIEIRFDPSIELTIFDKSKRVRPIRVAGVSSAVVQGGAQLTLSSDALNFSTAAATIRKPGGFTGADLFSLAADGRLLTPPKAGRGTEIALVADQNERAALSLYYPLRGPHVLALYKDEAQGTPTSLASLRVDGKQLLMPELTVVRADTLTLERGPFDVLIGADTFATGSLVLQIGRVGTEVREVEVASIHPELSLGQSASGDEPRQVSYGSVPGGVPLEVPVRVHIPNAWQPGEHVVAVAVSSEGGLRQQVPLTVNVIDRHRTTRIALLAVLAAIVLAVVARAVAKRHKMQSQEAAVRTHFIQDHYDDYAGYRERVEGLLSSDAPVWADVEQLLREFVGAKLHTGLPPQQWHAINEAAKRQNPSATLQALERALARFAA